MLEVLFTTARIRGTHDVSRMDQQAVLEGQDDCDEKG